MAQPIKRLSSCAAASARAAARAGCGAAILAKIKRIRAALDKAQAA